MHLKVHLWTTRVFFSVWPWILKHVNVCSQLNLICNILRLFSYWWWYSLCCSFGLISFIYEIEIFHEGLSKHAWPCTRKKTFRTIKGRLCIAGGGMEVICFKHCKACELWCPCCKSLDDCEKGVWFVPVTSPFLNIFHFILCVL